MCLQSVDSEEEEGEDEEDDDSVCSTDSDSNTMQQYVLGDVTHPHAAHGNAIIVHCVGMDLFLQ